MRRQRIQLAIESLEGRKLLASSMMRSAFTDLAPAADIRIGGSPQGNAQMRSTVLPAANAESMILQKAEDLGPTFTGAPSGNRQARMFDSAGGVEAVPGGYRMRFQRCDIYYAPALDANHAFEVHGAIRDRYNQLGGAGGVLGMPTSDRAYPSDGRVSYNTFAGGSIVMTASGAFEIVEPGSREFLRELLATPSLGVPVEGLSTLPAGGRALRCTNGGLYARPGVDSPWTVIGATYAKYRDLGETTGALGYPNGPGIGSGSFPEYARFEHGVLIDSGDAGVHPVYDGPIGAMYAGQNSHLGWLGYPVSDPESTPAGTTQEFEFGLLKSFTGGPISTLTIQRNGDQMTAWWTQREVYQWSWAQTRWTVDGHVEQQTIYTGEGARSTMTIRPGAWYAFEVQVATDRDLIGRLSWTEFSDRTYSTAQDRARNATPVYLSISPAVVDGFQDAFVYLNYPGSPHKFGVRLPWSSQQKAFGGVLYLPNRTGGTFEIHGSVWSGGRRASFGISVDTRTGNGRVLENPRGTSGFGGGDDWGTIPVAFATIKVGTGARWDSGLLSLS